MTFREHLSAIPLNGSEANATGLLPPIVRAIGHIMYVVGAIAEPGYTLTDEEARRELHDAATHLTRTPTTANSAPISSNAKRLVAAFCTLVTDADLEYGTWPEDERGPNIKELADRAAALAAYLDFEFAGLTGSQAGRSL